MIVFLLWLLRSARSAFSRGDPGPNATEQDSGCFTAGFFKMGGVSGAIVAGDVTSSSVRFRALALLAVCAALATSCSRPASPALRIGVDVDAGTLDPRLMRDTTAYRVVNLVHDGLVRLDRTLKPRPGLAESWDKPDPKTLLFHLRGDVRFHDGTPFTAEDVVYTFETLLDESLNAPLRALYTPIQRVEALDALTVKMMLREPYAPLLSYLDVGIVSRRRTAAGAEDPVGTGPYKLARWDKGSKIVLDANPQYWEGGPEVERLELVVIPDNTARAQAFEAGDLDLIQSPLSPQDVRRLEKASRFTHAAQPGLALTYLNFNCSTPPLDDPAVRRALSMLVDQDTILNRIYEGTDERATSILLPAWTAYASDVRQPTFDPEGARSLLARLGWRDSDGDGVLDRGGKKLAIEIGTHGEDVNRVQTVEFLQNAFQRFGIETRVSITDWASFSARRDAGNYQVILLGWTQLVDPDRVLFDQLHSRGGLNWGKYRNARLDELLERGRTTLEFEKRDRLYRDAARVVAEEVPYFILSYQTYQFFHDARRAGFEPDPRGMLRGLTRARLKAP